ncbi:Homeodomain-like protein, partial [Bombardia bombarda]
MARLSDSPHSPNQVSDATPSPPRPTTVNTGMWSTPEDERLREAVARHGTRWVSVAADVGTRNGEQCAKRWNDYVNPDLDHSPWSADEDRILLPLVALYGHNWKLMAQNFLQARAPLSIKNRYSLLMRRQKRQ